MINRNKVKELGNTNDLLAQYLFSEFEKNEDECISFIQSEANNGFDFFEVISKEIKEEYIPSIFSILEKLSCSTVVNVNTFHSFLLNLILENSSSYFVYDFIERFANENGEVAKDLLVLFENDTAENIGNYLTILVNSISVILIDEKYYKAQDYINSESLQKKNAGYSILENCILNDSFTDKDNAISLLKEKYNTSDKEPVLYSMCKLVETVTEFKDYIINAKKENNSKLDIIISKYIWLNYKKCSDNNFVKTLLFSFTTVDYKLMGIIGNIDFLLIELVDNDFDTFFVFFTKWIQESNFHSSNKKIDEIWVHTCSHLVTYKNVNKIYTEFFLKDEITYHMVAANFISLIGIVHNQDVKIDEQSIEGCDMNDMVFLCRKILGHVYDIDVQCQLFVSIMKAKFEDDLIRNLIHSIFVNNLIPDYTVATLRFINNKLQTDDKKYQTFYSELIDICNQILSNKEKDIFPEMKITYEQRNCYLRKQHEDNKILSKEANSKSVILNLCKPVMTLYGKGFCYNVNDSSKSVASDFHSFDTSFYLSCRDIYSPVDAEIERFNFRLAKRGDK